MIWPTRTGHLPVCFWVVLILGFALIGSTAGWVGMTPEHFSNSGPRAAEILKGFATKPDMSYLGTLCSQMLETLAMSVIASVLAIVIAIPLAFLAARVTTPLWGLALVIRFSMALFRAIPDLVWALAFVTAVGLGPIPGVAALTITTLAFLCKFHYESLDVTSKGPVEGLAAHGAGWLSQRVFGVLPQAAPDWVGQWIYSVDSNLRSATILGYVGAGGIGFDFANSIRILQYDRIPMIVVAIFVLVSALDRVSDRIRRRLI